MSPVLGAIFVIVLSFTIVYLALAQHLFSYLRVKHPRIHTELGQPHLFLNNTPSLVPRLFRFIFRNGYVNLGDPHLTALCDRLRWLVVALTVGYLVFFGLFAAAASRGAL
jgi:hypothetical protein